MAAYSHHPREWSQPAYTPILEGRRPPNSPPTPPPTTSTLSPPLHNLHHHTSSGSAGTAGILTPPSSPLKPQQQAQAQAQSHSQPHHKSSDSGVGLSSYPSKYNHAATTNELSKPYPLYSTIPRTPYQGNTSLCDLLDDVLDSMTEFSHEQPPPPPPPPHPGTPVILGPQVQARPISLLRCTSVSVDDESLARYTKCARTFVRRVEGGIGMWGLNRFMTALRSGGMENEGGDGNPGACVSSVCSLLALRDGEDSYGASQAERLTSVEVDVRTLLDEVGAGLRELGAGVGEGEKEAMVVVKKDIGWEKNKLERLAELLEMLLASLIPAIEDCLVDGGREEPGMRAFVPEGVVGRAGSPFIFEGAGSGVAEGAYYYHRPEDVGVREATPSPEKTKREFSNRSLVTERSMANNTIWQRGSRTTTPSPTDPPNQPQQPQRTTSFQIPPQPTRDRSQFPPSSASSLRASSFRASYSRQNADSMTLKPPQLDRLSTITANTTATGDTFMDLTRSMRVAVEVEGITEEELGIGGPGNWGGSEYDFDQGSAGVEGKKKWWRGGWGGKKRAARGKEKSMGEFDSEVAAPAGAKKKGWKRFLCFGGEE